MRWTLYATLDKVCTLQRERRATRHRHFLRQRQVCTGIFERVHPRCRWRRSVDSSKSSSSGNSDCRCIDHTRARSSNPDEVSIRSVISNVMQLAEAGQTVKKGIIERMIRHLPKSTVRKLGIFAHGEKGERSPRRPVFDSQFSNRCYQNAVRQAFYDFVKKRARRKINSKPMSRLPNSGLASSCAMLSGQAHVPRCVPTRPTAHAHVGRRRCQHWPHAGTTQVNDSAVLEAWERKGRYRRHFQDTAVH